MKTEEFLVIYVESMADFMGIIVQSMTKEENNLTEKLSEKVIEDAVEKELDALKTEIIQFLQDAKEMINSMSPGRQNIVKNVTNGSSAENGQ